MIKMKTKNRKRLTALIVGVAAITAAAYASVCYEYNPPSEQQCGDKGVACYYFCNGTQMNTSCTSAEFFAEVIVAPADGSGRTTGIPCECYCTQDCGGNPEYNACCTTSNYYTDLNGEPCYGG